MEHIFGKIGSSLIKPNGITSIRPNFVSPATSPLWNKYTYMPAAIGTHTLIAEMIGGAGIWATYYAPDLAAPYLTRTDSTIDFSSSSSNLGPWPGIQSSFLSVRWSTYFQPPSNGNYSFQAYLLEQNCRIRLYFDNYLVVDQWSSLTTLQPVKAVGILDANQYYAIKIEYTRVGLLPQFGIKLRSAVSNGSFAPVPSTSLFLGYPLQGSPFSFQVFGGFACAAASTLFLASASYMTAGISSSFCLTTRDSFGNPSVPLLPARIFAYARYPTPPILDSGKVIAIMQIQNGSEFQIDGGQANLTSRMYNALAGQIIEISGETRIVAESTTIGVVLVATNFSNSPLVGAPYIIRALPRLSNIWSDMISSGPGKFLRISTANCCTPLSS